MLKLYERIIAESCIDCGERGRSQGCEKIMVYPSVLVN